MCRNIHTLFNFDPPADEEEIYEASLQYVRKISGFQKPSLSNQKAFDNAIKQISHSTKTLINSLETDAKPKNRDEEHRKAHELALKRFSKN